MSGGFWEYKDSSLRYDIFGWICDDDNIPNVFEDREISDIVYDVFKLLHDFDYYKSGDISKSTYLISVDEFKKKWFKTESTERLKGYIDQEVKNLRKELYYLIGEDIDE